MVKFWSSGGVTAVIAPRGSPVRVRLAPRRAAKCRSFVFHIENRMGQKRPVVKSWSSERDGLDRKAPRARALRFPHRHRGERRSANRLALRPLQARRWPLAARPSRQSRGRRCSGGRRLPTSGRAGRRGHRPPRSARRRRQRARRLHAMPIARRRRRVRLAPCGSGRRVAAWRSAGGRLELTRPLMWPEAGRRVGERRCRNEQLPCLPRARMA